MSVLPNQKNCLYIRSIALFFFTLVCEAMYTSEAGICGSVVLQFSSFQKIILKFSSTPTDYLCMLQL
jgi:hypothetical protein